MFVGREREMAVLEREFSASGFRMAVVYGRRRVGKTELLRQFIKGKRGIYLGAVRGKGRNEAKLAKLIPREYLPVDTGDMESLILAVGDMSEDGRTVLIIDEFPYLANSDKAFTSILQQLIDDQLRDKDMMLVLCGSSMGAMRNGVLGSKSPLYGRKTSVLKVEPFDYLESAEMLDGFTVDEKFRIYSMVGGIPMYLALFDPSRSLGENIASNFLDASSILLEEPSGLIRQEMRDPDTYAGLLSAMAAGRTRLSEIASAACVETSATSNRLSELTFLDIVEKTIPYGDKGRSSRYRISDNLFRFHYAMVEGFDLPLDDAETEASLKRIDRDMRTYLGRSFEDVCRRYCRLRMGCTWVGGWHGPDPETRTVEEIDIVGYDANSDDGHLLFGECKYTAHTVGMGEMDLLIRRSMLVGCRSRRYVLFSRAGFDDALVRYAEANGVSLVNMDDLYRV